MYRLNKNLLFSVWALATGALGSLMLTRELDLTIVLAVTIIAPFIFHFELKDRLRKIRWLENSLILFFFFVSIFGFFFLKSSFLIVVANFLIAFILLKLSFKKDRGDLMQIIALSFFLLLSTATLALDFTFVFCFIVYVLTATWTLSIYTLAEESNEKWRVQSEKFENKEEWTEKIFRHILRNCWLSLGLTIFFAVFIFIFFPRLSLAVFQGTFLGSVQKTGFSETINLVKSGKIMEDPTVVMRIKIKDEKRRNQQIYMRGTTLSHFDGKEWTSSAKREGAKIGSVYKTRIYKVEKKRFHIQKVNEFLLKKDYAMKVDQQSCLYQKVYLEPLGTPILFGVAWVQFIDARLPQITVFQDGSFQRPGHFTGRIAYEVKSLIERPQEKILSARAKSSGKFKVEGARTKEETAEISDNLQLPETDFSKVQNLIRKITSKRDSPYLKARKIEKYLRENCRYTLEIESKDVHKPLEQFLFDSKKGHCEYFASAMALMLRLEKIPTRVVNGFLANEWNPNGNYFVVRAKDAHSWVESYVGGIWIEIDPSPKIPAKEWEKATLWSIIKQKIDYLNFLWNNYVLSYDMESQKKLAKNVELKSNHLSMKLDRILGKWKIKIFKIKRLWGETEQEMNPPSQSINYESKDQGNFKRIMMNLIILLTILTLAFIVYRHRKNLMFYFKKRVGSETGKPYYFYLKMLKILSKTGIKKKESETPYEFARRFSVALKNESPAKTVTMSTPVVSPVMALPPEKKHENLSHFQKVHEKLIFITDSYYKIRFSKHLTNRTEFLNIKKSLKELSELISH